MPITLTLSLLTLSLPIPLRLYTLPLLIFVIRALLRLALSARAPHCQRIKNDGLDQYGAGPFEQQEFGTPGVGGVNLALFYEDQTQNG